VVDFVSESAFPIVGAKGAASFIERRWEPARRVLALVALSLPALAACALDLSHRSGRIGRFSSAHLAHYGLSLLQAGLVWGLLLHTTVSTNALVRRIGTAVFVLVFTVALGSQSYFFDQYQSYINRDISLFARDFVASVANQASADLAGISRANLPFLALAVALCLLARRVVHARALPARHSTWLAPLALGLAFVLPLQDRRWQAATPDMLYLSAVGSFVSGGLGQSSKKQPPPRVRQPLPLPPLQPRPGVRRNVALIITESVRADAACSAYDPACALTPYSNALPPERIGLRQLRAVASTTSTALAVLWSGLPPTASADDLYSWPLLFDYAGAAGFDTAFWTSQNLDFGRTGLWVKNLGARLFVSANQLDPEADLDLGADEALLADHLEQEFEQLSEPFLAVIQLSNTHHPYQVVSSGPAPFQPAERSPSPKAAKRFRNFYQNAVVQQDEHVARMIRALRRSEAGKRTVILFTSDHGEAFREHHQMGHTFSVYDEEVHVPGYVDAPRGTLSESERDALRARAEVPVFHTDVVPTVLDLMRIRGLPALEAVERRLIGTSWLGPLPQPSTVPLTNCSALWNCVFENWGVMSGSLKVLARTPYDRGWRCYDVLEDPREKQPLHTPRCRELRQEALAIFGRLPR
jgi:glucan phosphoethanolaminetransferase (alkaline phosphatase superfamily)